MDEAVQADQSTALVDMSIRQVIQVVIWGMLVGLLAWGFTFFLEQVVLKAIMCGGTGVNCSVGMLAGIWGGLGAACVALFGLVRLRIFRPLLVVIAATISLWGLAGVVDALPVYSVGIAYVLLYGAAYIAFTWIVRVRLFWLAICLLLPVCVVVRLLLNS